MKKVLFSLLIFLTQGAYAQHYQFSQQDFTQIRINPASISTSDFARLDINYRRQQTAANFSLNSFQLSTSYPIIKRNGGSRWSAIGLSFLNDRSGLGGLFKTTEAGITYAMNTFVAKHQGLSFGMQANYQSRRVSLDHLSTGAQYIPNIGFDPAINSGEDFMALERDFFSYSAGLLWLAKDRWGRKKTHLGISFFGLNQPNENFYDKKAILPVTLVATGGIRVFEQRELSIYTEFLWTNSAAVNDLSIGTVLSYELEGYSKNGKNSLDIHSKYIIGSSASIGLRFHRDNFSFGVNYDVPVHNNVANKGAFEFGASFKQLVESRFKTKRKRVKRKRLRRKSKKNRFKRKRTKKKRNRTRRRRKKGFRYIPQKRKQADSVAIKKELIIADNDTNEEKEKDHDKGIKATTEIGKIRHEPLVLEDSRLEIHFDFDISEPSDKIKTYVSELAAVLNGDRNIKVRIVGHTDDRGSAGYNQRLSEQRAAKVEMLFLKKGITKDRIKIEGKGESTPLNNNESIVDRAKNRRVEIILFY